MLTSLDVSHLAAKEPNAGLRRSIDEFIQVLMVNVVGTFAVTKSFLPLLKRGNKKTIVNISSNAASLSRNFACIQKPSVSDASLALSYRVAKVGVNMGAFCLCCCAAEQL